ncbi:SsgA family sporulation/cell division regulator [Streptacidiphilus jiangxiensis]|uniref:Streptomyces sporulation and cell division protein, SsgA n=1 Tax=Streptacidiphilus jiangxiensis TaxID=235985 RepID=A0A1H7RMS9_STRJI|nr:SsgA family sporulation/cell division regulator [Streptacidiphilus jiangxiensis]SEL61349.1 Streptomyces sporulation and cell division protein, SsgA [Streptacidiphilus jiangxiensis]
MNSTLRGQITMELATTAGLSYQIPVRLAFHQATSWAIELTFFLPGDEPVQWTVSRELLLDGLSTVAGEGDVRVRPLEWEDDDLVAITLRSPEGEAELIAPLTALHAYLLRTDMMTPFGEEFSDEWLDRGITRLLTGAELHN